MPLTFYEGADPELVAKITKLYMKACEPSCVDCGRRLAKRDVTTGLCRDNEACRLRRILKGPKCRPLTYGLA